VLGTGAVVGSKLLRRARVALAGWVPSGPLFTIKSSVEIARRLARSEQTMRVWIARDELQRIREQTRTIKTREHEIIDLVTQLAPRLLAEPGCGTERRQARPHPDQAIHTINFFTYEQQGLRAGGVSAPSPLSTRARHTPIGALARPRGCGR
jgi:hypothetical protein